MPSASQPSDEDAARRRTFPRTHRLKRRQLIRSLFDRRRSDVDTEAVGCVRLVYRIVPRTAIGHDVPLQIGFAPGRRVQNAVQRNRVRRVLREVYRVHQHLLVDLFVRRDDALIVMAIFRGDPAAAGDCVPRDLPEALRRVAARIAADRA